VEPEVETTSSGKVQALLAQDRPLVIAHRGYSLAAPENTLAAFQLAALGEADLIELDYRPSQDDVLMVLHDATLDRTTDAAVRWRADNIAVSDRTAEELGQLDAGSWFDPRFKGIRVPKLEDALALIQTSSVTLIERKAGDAGSLILLLREKNLTEEVIVQAFDWDFLAECHAKAPSLVLGALAPPYGPDGRTLPVEEQCLSIDFLDRIDRTGARVIVWSRQASPAMIAEAKRRGYRVWIYTIDDLDTALTLLASGVDGIISNNPPVIWKALALALV
jgi:glycerophosphoryl diester phosphodiesterase